MKQFQRNQKGGISAWVLIALCVVGAAIIYAVVTIRSPKNELATYADPDYGFSFEYPLSLLISHDADGNLVLSATSSGSAPVTISKRSGRADDSTGKWGKYVIYNSGGNWLVERQSARDDSIYSTVISPSFNTDSGLPVFNGGIQSHGWGLFNYVVALSKDKFLVVSGPDNSSDQPYSAAADPTLPIVKSVRNK